MQLSLDLKSITQMHYDAVAKQCDAHMLNDTYTLIVQRYTHALKRHARILPMQTHVISHGYWLWLDNDHVLDHVHF